MSPNTVWRDIEPLFDDRKDFTRGRLIGIGARPFKEDFETEIYLDKHGVRAVYEPVNPTNKHYSSFAAGYRLRNITSSK